MNIPPCYNDLLYDVQRLIEKVDHLTMEVNLLFEQVEFLKEKIPDWLWETRDPDAIMAWLALDDSTFKTAQSPIAEQPQTDEVKAWIAEQKEFTTRDLADEFGISLDKARKYAKRYATAVRTIESGTIIWSPRGSE